MILALLTLTNTKTSTKSKATSVEFFRGNLKVTVKTYRRYLVKKGGEY